MKIGHLYFSTINLLSIYSVPGTVQGFPSGVVVKNLPANAGDVGDMGWIPGSGRSPGGRKWQPIPVFLPRRCHEQRRLAGYSPQGCKESERTEHALIIIMSLFT